MQEDKYSVKNIYGWCFAVLLSLKCTCYQDDFAVRKLMQQTRIKRINSDLVLVLEWILFYDIVTDGLTPV